MFYLVIDLEMCRVPRDYRSKAYHYAYDPEWIGSETFKKEEWNILRDVCMKMYPDEKLTF